MSARKRRSVVESVFDRNQRREAEINEALKQDAARHAAVVKNMQRLRALRLAREELRLAREEKRRARNSRLRGQLFNANNRRRVDNQREAQCQLPMIIEQWLKNAFGVRKKPKPTMNAKAISN